MDLEEVRQKMQKALEFVTQDLGSIRTGRASSALVENLVIEAYGGASKMRLLEVASISTPDNQTIVIQPYDQSIIGDIKRDLGASNMGFQPVIDNQIIRISIPPLTTERRQEFVKLLHRKLEDGRVKIRQARHDKMSEIKKSAEDKELNEDDRKRLEDELQKMTDGMMEDIQKLGVAKEAELMSV